MPERKPTTTSTQFIYINNHSFQYNKLICRQDRNLDRTYLPTTPTIEIAANNMYILACICRCMHACGSELVSCARLVRPQLADAQSRHVGQVPNNMMHRGPCDLALRDGVVCSLDLNSKTFNGRGSACRPFLFFRRFFLISYVCRWRRSLCCPSSLRDKLQQGKVWMRSETIKRGFLFAYFFDYTLLSCVNNQY